MQIAPERRVIARRRRFSKQSALNGRANRMLDETGPIHDDFIACLSETITELDIAPVEAKLLPVALDTIPRKADLRYRLQIHEAASPDGAITLAVTLSPNLVGDSRALGAQDEVIRHSIAERGDHMTAQKTYPSLLLRG